MSRASAVSILAAGQHGLVTRTDLRRLQVPDSTITEWVRSGRLRRLHPGVFAVGGSVDTWMQRVTAAVLAAGDPARASHRCAAAVWRLDDVIGRSIDVLSPRHTRPNRLAGVIIHESRDLPIADGTTLDGLRVTSVERTVIDVARYWPERRVGACLDDAVRRRLTTYERVTERFLGLARRGRPGIVTIRRVLEARQLLNGWAAADFEGMMLRLLRGAGLGPPVCQHPVVVGDNRYYIDFFYPDGCVGVECDSQRFHTLQFQAEADLRRQNEIQGTGILLLRYTPRPARRTRPRHRRDPPSPHRPRRLHHQPPPFWREPCHIVGTTHARRESGGESLR